MSERTPLPHASSILALSADTATAHAALIEPVGGSHRLIGWESASLPPGEAMAIHAALRGVSYRLGARLDRALWDESDDSPLLSSSEPALGLHLGQTVAAVDPLPPLRVWIGGLTSHESLAAAQSSLESTVCQTVAVYRFGMGGGPAQLTADLNDIRPDLAVVVGGYDRAESTAARPVLDMCAELAQALASLPSGQRPAVYFAGNRFAAAAALEMWSHLPGGLSADAVENVAPAPATHRGTSLAVATSRLYWRRCRSTPTVQTISRWITAPSEVRSVSWSFAQAVRLWRQVHNLPSLHGLYCAGPLWIHVCAEEGKDGVRLRFARPFTRPDELTHWPPLRLVSGPWPDSLWPRPQTHWWDPTGLTPTVANVGQVDPLVTHQVLAQDLLHEG
ncbi:MAG: hypothetical protein WBO46_25130 [Caldilineaceae bacterium]